MKRKLISLSLALCMMLAFIPSVSASAGGITFLLRPAEGTPDTLSPGEEFTMEVYLSNPLGTSIGSISGLSVRFDTASLEWGIEGDYEWYTNMPFAGGEISSDSRLSFNPPSVIHNDAADHPFGRFNAHFSFDSIVDFTELGGVLMTLDLRAKKTLSADALDIAISVNTISTYHDVLLYRGIDFVAAPERVASSWAHDGIKEAIRKGFVPSDLRNNYTNIITREEFCRMAVRWVEYYTNTDIDTILIAQGLTRDPDAFTDTNDPDILAAYALGITSGRGGGIFDPNGQFTREQAATMIMNTCIAAGADVSDIPDSSFADIGTAAAWALPGIGFVQTHSIMAGTGGGNFSPKDTYTREQSVVTFNNIFTF